MYHPNLRTVSDVVTWHAALRPDHPAVICADRAVTYRELHLASNRTAHALRRLGVDAGQRIAYLGRESEHYYDILFAAAKLGAVLVPVNRRLTAAETHHILRDSGSTVLFVDDELLGTAMLLRAELPDLREVVSLARFAGWQAADESDVDYGAAPDEPVVQMYTSGTTGRPKGVVLAHRSFFAVRDALAAGGLDWIDWRVDDVSLVGVPGFHVGGLWWAMQGFAAGVTNVSVRTFTGPGAVALIRRHRITTACLVPAQLQMILAPPRPKRADFATLRKIVYGGSPISESLLARCIATIGCELAQIYGLTESGNTAVCLPPADHVVGGERMQAAGRPYPGFEVKIVDADGAEVPAGESGEVWLATPARMLGYWGMPETTDESCVDGWLRTGDAGYLDADGYLFVRDRIKDMIVVAGENVYPAEIENAVCAHPAVLEAAVVGIPHRHWGEAVHCFAVPRPGQTVTARELAVFLRGRLADFKLPTSYELVGELPRNPSGKILRRDLRERFWAHLDRRVA
ncbi:MAG: long-chain-fatty-acid--CoA ligase [Actinophytocola sp.]|uniref:long-chain-fatty-acid--CoA ligase n=1 Tax=Actinophytocola sp. TaxID=1872138 RepID=UPI0013213C3B|nr:long-chain-fatty-acid--CoA ligase [Actinophytocola sp.]MPZ85085.1 long-chain-fatty-acid--CoA ligase [Actinophytocola sp.]